jgi:hypothetical protein
MTNTSAPLAASKRETFVNRIRFTFDMASLALAAVIVIGGGVDPTIRMFAKLVG